jgi:hypothetical protein
LIQNCHILLKGYQNTIFVHQIFDEDNKHTLTQGRFRACAWARLLQHGDAHAQARSHAGPLQGMRMGTFVTTWGCARASDYIRSIDVFLGFAQCTVRISHEILFFKCVIDFSKDQNALQP